MSTSRSDLVVQRLDDVAVGAQELKIGSLASGYVGHDGDSVSDFSFCRSATVDVIELEDAVVVDSASRASTAKSSQGLLAHLSESVFAPFALVLARMIDVLVTPLLLVLAPFWATVRAGFTALGVVALSAPQALVKSPIFLSAAPSGEILFGEFSMAPFTRSHVFDLTKGKRAQVAEVDV